jgi:hypothetical protein
VSGEKLLFLAVLVSPMQYFRQFVLTLMTRPVGGICFWDFLLSIQPIVSSEMMTLGGQEICASATLLSSIGLGKLLYNKH